MYIYKDNYIIENSQLVYKIIKFTELNYFLHFTSEKRKPY